LVVGFLLSFKRPFSGKFVERKLNVLTQFKQASIKTADNLRTVARSIRVTEVSSLSLPEIDAAVDIISRLVPAGNVPGVILNGLARISGRRPPPANIRRDVNLLFKGVEGALDKAVYGAFFAGPAAIIWGYQHLLKIAGKDPENAFPDGLWQFYVEYALREDTARHANETRGFDEMLDRHQIRLHPVDRITAWVMAAIHVLYQYPDLLANEWRERMYLSVLAEVTADQPDAGHYAALYRAWDKTRPYSRGPDVDPKDNFAAYRRQKFDEYLAESTRNLSVERYQQWTARLQTMRQELKDYQQQLSIWAYLEPDSYGETRTALTWEQLHVGLIYQGQYYLIPVGQAGSKQPAPITAVREQVAAIYGSPTGRTAASLTALATMKRSNLADFRRHANKTLAASLGRLQQAPVLFNADQRPSHLPLIKIRQGERGVGDHPLTLFDTGRTVAFDQSHIFFDGAWGASLAEIFTREAMSWAVYLNRLPPANHHGRVVKPLAFPLEAAERRIIERAGSVTPEVSAETDKVNLRMMFTMRRLFKQRNDWLNLTVNDLLILYRAIHAVVYQPEPGLAAEVAALANKPGCKQAAAQAQASFNAGQSLNPAILIPIDAACYSPRDRLYPLVFEAPLRELDLLAMHGRVLNALTAYKQGEIAFETFNQHQRDYLAALAGFGQVFNRAKEIGVRGESASTGSIKLLANMPVPVQRMLDGVPGRFDLLNDLIKGREVFSNVGRVVRGSSLTRFSTAKDDNEKKSLAWGVLTDDEGVMRITLRDFRPHVAALKDIDHQALAGRMAQHYLDSYAEGLNKYIRELYQIAAARKSF
jgi:hypothetical protein